VRVTPGSRVQVVISGSDARPGVQADTASAAEGADLFVCEAYTFDRPVRHHLHLPELIEHLDRLRGTRVLLTHPGPQVLARRTELKVDLELELAEDGLVVEV
jgi:hypothetical protein